MGAGNGFAGSSFPNQTKILPGNPDMDTADVGPVHPLRRHAGPDHRRRAHPPPGDLLQHLLRRERVRGPRAPRGRVPVPAVGRRRAHLHLADGQPGRLPGPAPHLHAQRPARAESYKPQPLETFSEIVPRTAPPITLKGGGAYRDSLSEEIQKVLTKQSSPEDAAKSLAGSLGQDHRRRRRRPPGRGAEDLRGRVPDGHRHAVGLGPVEAATANTEPKQEAGAAAAAPARLRRTIGQEGRDGAGPPGPAPHGLHRHLPGDHRHLHRVHVVGPDDRCRFLARVRVLVLVRRLLGGADAPASSGARCGAPC